MADFEIKKHVDLKQGKVGTTSGSGGAEYFYKPQTAGGGGGGAEPVQVEEGAEPGLEGTEAGEDNPLRGED